jgi:transcriptional regulator with XRE-family HTH domain
MPSTRLSFPTPLRIFERRKALGITLEEAARRVRRRGARCHTTTFWRWEAGEVSVPYRSWDALAAALETTPRRLGARIPSLS